jgi:hypothetical protein
VWLWLRRLRKFRWLPFNFVFTTSGRRSFCLIKAFQKFCGPSLVGAGSRPIALRKCPEVNIVIAGKTPDQGGLFIVSLELPMDRSCLPVIPGDRRVLACDAAALLLQLHLGQRHLQRPFVLTDPFELVQVLGSVC